jgi:hypothetical protein
MFHQGLERENVALFTPFSRNSELPAPFISSAIGAQRFFLHTVRHLLFFSPAPLLDPNKARVTRRHDRLTLMDSPVL